MNQPTSTNTDVDDDCVFKPLIDRLNNISQYTGNNYILEIRHLKAFPPRSVILPDTFCSPRVIIEHIINMHALAAYKLTHNLDNLQSFVYKYNYKGHLKQFVFSNNMSLDFDIITLCYLYLVVLNNRQYISIWFKLFEIMADKYQISLLRIFSNYFLDSLYWEQIINSFPSIWYPLAACYTTEVQSIFPNYVIPDLFKLCMLPSIIPKLKSSYNLIPVLIAINIKNVQKYINPYFNPSQYDPLDKIYNSFNELYFSKAFPECLKLKLCEMWDIVFRKNDKYDYNLLFLKCRDEAINVIESYSPDPCVVDPIIIKILLS